MAAVEPAGGAGNASFFLRTLGRIGLGLRPSSIWLIWEELIQATVTRSVAKTIQAITMETITTVMVTSSPASPAWVSTVH
jgi:hypothetical protein